jgi:predicted lactoylglutathione lyase
MARLGDKVLYTTGVKSLEKSEKFYAALGFLKVDEGNAPHFWAMYTDGGLILNLYEDATGKGFSGVGYFSAYGDAIIRALHAEGAPFDINYAFAKDGFEVLATPNQLRISVTRMSADQLPELGERTANAGRFYGISLLSKNLQADEAFWRQLGFTDKQFGNSSCVVLSDGLLRIGLYKREACPHYFEGPTLTYFGRTMYQDLAALERKGIKFHEKPMPGPGGRLDNAVLLSPEGQAFFLFTEELDF